MYLEKLNELLGSLPLIKIRQIDAETWRAATMVNNKLFVAFHEDCKQAIEDCAMLAVRENEPYDPFEEAVWGDN